MKLKLITPTMSTPITLEQAKAYYRVIGDEENEVIERTITTAISKAEQKTNRQLMGASSYEGYMDTFPNAVVLPKPPFISLSKIEYVDIEGETQLWEDYEIDDFVEPAVLHFLSKPIDANGKLNSIKITFDCGYIDLPEPIVSWCLIYGLTLFENRENLVIGTIVSEKAKDYYNHLLDSYRIIPV